MCDPQRRLLIGVALTAAAAAFALVPTDSLRLVKPQKPLFVYLVPLLRVQVSGRVLSWLSDFECVVLTDSWVETVSARQQPASSCTSHKFRDFYVHNACLADTRMQCPIHHHAGATCGVPLARLTMPPNAVNDQAHCCTGAPERDGGAGGERRVGGAGGCAAARAGRAQRCRHQPALRCHSCGPPGQLQVYCSAQWGSQNIYLAVSCALPMPSVLFHGCLTLLPCL